MYYECIMSTVTHYGKGRDIFNQFIQRGLGLQTVYHCKVSSEWLHRDADLILGHSCIAVKMLALQGGIYNVCGMYNV